MAQAFNLTAQLNLRGPTNVNAVVTNIRRQIGNITANVNINVNPSTANNIAQLNTRLAGLNTTLRITATRATTASQAIRQLGQAFSSVHVGNIPAQINAAATAIGNLHRANANVHTALAQTSTEMEEFGRQAGLAIRRFSAFSTVSGVIFGLTNAVTQGLKAFIDYDREIVKLQQVTGESAAGLAGLGKTISNLATSLGVSSSELTSVASTLAQAGLSARDTEKALKALALSSLAPSFDDMNKTVEGSIALMRQFGISAGDLDKALGSINAVAAKFAVEASDIVTAIQRTGGVFATASKGVSEGTDALNEFMAIFTSVRATTRESAETIATGLRTIFTRVQRGSTIEALKEYGVNLQDLDGKFVGAYKAVELLSKGLSSIDPRDMKFSQIVEELGGFRQIGKVIPLIQQFTTTQEALKVAQQGQGSLAKDAATAQLSLANQIQKVRQEFLTLFRAIGSSDTFQVMIKGALSLSSAFIKIADSIKGILPALAIFAAFKGASAATQFVGGFAGAVRGGQRRAEGGPIRRFATGGFVPGSGDGDTVPARLTPGEFVIRKKAVQAIGVDNLHQMNRYADGGTVRSKNAENFINNRYKSGGVVRKTREFSVEELLKTSGSNTIKSELNKENTNLENVKNKTYEDKAFINVNTRSVNLSKTDFKKIWDMAQDSAKNSPGKYKSYSGIDVSAENRKKISLKYGKLPYKKSSEELSASGQLMSAEGRWGKAYESVLVDKLKNNWKESSKRTNYPVDLIQELEDESIKSVGEAKFKVNKTRDIDLVSKMLRYRIDKQQINFPEYFKERTETGTDKPNLGQLEYFSAENQKQAFYSWIQKQQKNKVKGFNTGGLVQKFAAGDVVKRSVGYLDSDVLGDAANSAIVGPEMERLQLKKISEYKMYLSQLAIGSRKKGDISKFTSLVGVAGAGKSSLVQGRGTDTGRLRQTSRFPILTAQDISRATEVLDITSTVTPAKLEAYLTQSDRIIALSSSTKEEMEEVKRRRGRRDVTGENLFGRKAGSTKKAPSDSGELEAMLASEIESKKIRTLGVKTGGGFSIKRDTGISVETGKKGLFFGGFSPLQKGHESMVDLASSMGIDPSDFIALVGSNEGIDGSDPHSFRTAIFDQDFRTALAKAGFGAKGARVSRKRDMSFGVPDILELEGGKNGKRHFARLGSGSIAFTQGKTPEQLEKYSQAGLSAHNIEDRVGGFSGTQARDAILSGNVNTMKEILSPAVFDIINKNLSQLQNRANILPKLMEKIGKRKDFSLSSIKQQIDAFPIKRVDNKKLAIEGPDSEYGKMVAQLTELRKMKTKIEGSSKFEPFSLIRKLSKRYPDTYGLNFEGASSGLQEGILRAATNQKVSQDDTDWASTFIPAPSIAGVKSGEVAAFFKGMKLPINTNFGDSSGQLIDNKLVQKVWRKAYDPIMKPEKIAAYSAIKEYLQKEYFHKENKARDKTIASIAKSTKVGVVGLQPANKIDMNGPEMLGGENVTMFISGISSKYEKDIAKVRRTLRKTVGAFGSNLEKTSGASKSSLRNMSEQEENASGMANIEGAVLEMVLARLGAVGGTVQNRAIDYPNGLGARAAKFFPGIGANWPTEVKRTLDSNAISDAKKEFIRYFSEKNGVSTPIEETVKMAVGGKIHKFARGGSAEDTVPALLTPGEFVINKNAADRIGLGNLHKLNHADKISGFNKGGSVGGVQRFLTGGNVERTSDRLVQNNAALIEPNLLTTISTAFRGMGNSLTTTNAQFTRLGRSVGRTGADLTNFTALQNRAGNKTIGQIKAAIQADIQATQAQAGMTRQTQALRDVLEQVTTVEQAATNSIRDTREARRANTTTGRLTAAVSGQAGFYATAALGALGGQAENIFGKKTTSATSAQNAAGFEAATSTASTGLALAGQSLAIPIIGPLVAGLTLAATAIATWTNYVEAGTDALNAFNTDLKNKKIEDANEKLAISFNNFSKDLNNIDLANIVKGDIKTSVGSVNAGTGQDIINKQRDMRKEQISKMGMVEYAGSFVTGITEPTLGAKDYEAATKESAKKLEPAKEASMVIFEQMLKKGEISLQDFATSTDEFAVNQRKAIVLSDPTAMGKYAEMQARASAEIQKGNNARAAEIQLEAEQFVTTQALDNAQLKSIESSVALNKAMEDASKAGRKLAESFGRLTDSLNQALNRTVFQLSALDDATQSMIQSFGGDAKNQVVRSEAANTLANPKAYSDQKVEAAVKQAVNMVGGPQSQEGAMMEGILSLNHTLEKQMAGSVRAAVGNDANLSIEKGVNIARTAGIAEIQGSALPQQSKDQLITQLTSGLTAIQEKLAKDTTGESSGKLELDKLEAELKDAAKLATEGINKELNETAQKLLEFRADSFNKYTESLNLIAEKQIEAAGLYQKAADIGVDGAQKLREALTGASTSLGDVVANKVNQTSRLTGGAVDPALIAGNIRNLDAQRIAKQAEVTKSFNAGNMPDAIKFNNELSIINVQLKNNQSALKNLASDTELASAAMNRLNEVTKAQEATKNASEKLLTSDKKSLRQQSQTFNRLQARNNGQLVRSTPEQRAQEFEMLRNNKDIFTAQYQRNAQNMQRRGVNIDSSPQAAEQKYNEMYARVTESMFHSSGGVGTYGPAGSAIIDQSVSTSNNKANDPLYAEAVAVYRSAIDIQRNANVALGNLTLELSRNLMGQAVDRFNNSLPTFLDNLKQARDKDASIEHPVVGVNGKVVNVNTVGQPKIAELAADYKPPSVVAPVTAAKGGLIYASAGQYVNFEPKGTDTVPAMLTRGEFVVNAASTAKNLPLLQAINKQKGGVVYLGGGGPVNIEDALMAPMGSSMTSNAAATADLIASGTFAGITPEMVAGMNSGLPGMPSNPISDQAPTEIPQQTSAPAKEDAQLKQLEIERTEAQKESWMLNKAVGTSPNEVATETAKSWAFSQVGQTNWLKMNEEQKQAEIDKYKPEFEKRWNDYNERSTETKLKVAQSQGYDRIQDDPNHQMVGVHTFYRDKRKAEAEFKTKNEAYTKAKDEATAKDKLYNFTTSGTLRDSAITGKPQSYNSVLGDVKKENRENNTTSKLLLDPLDVKPETLDNTVNINEHRQEVKKAKQEDNMNRIRLRALDSSLPSYKAAAEQDPTGLRSDGKTTNKEFYDSKNDQFQKLKAARDLANPEAAARRDKNMASAKKIAGDQTISADRVMINKGLSAINQDRVKYLETYEQMQKDHPNGTEKDWAEKTRANLQDTAGIKYSEAEWASRLDKKETVNQLIAGGVSQDLIRSYISGPNQSRIGQLSNKTKEGIPSAPGSNSYLEEGKVTQEIIKGGAGLGRLKAGAKGLATDDKMVFGLKSPTTIHTDALTFNLEQAAEGRNLTASELQDQREKESDLLDKQIAEDRKASAKRNEEHRARIAAMDPEAASRKLQQGFTDKDTKQAYELAIIEKKYDDEIAGIEHRLSPEGIAEANKIAQDKAIEEKNKIEKSRKDFADSKPERDRAIRETVDRQNAARAAQEQANTQTQTQAKEQDGMWVNSSNPIYAGLGYLGGVGEAGGRLVRGGLYAGIGAAASLGSNLIGDNTEEAQKSAQMDIKVKEYQAKQAQQGVLAAQGSDQQAQLAQSHAQLDAQTKQIESSSRDAFKETVDRGTSAGLQDVASVGSLLTNQEYKPSAVGEFNTQEAQKLRDRGQTGLANVLDVNNYVTAAASEAIPALVSGGANMGSFGARTGLNTLRQATKMGVGKTARVADRLFGFSGTLGDLGTGIKYSGTVVKNLANKTGIQNSGIARGIKGIHGAVKADIKLGKQQLLGSLSDIGSSIKKPINKVVGGVSEATKKVKSRIRAGNLASERASKASQLRATRGSTLQDRIAKRQFFDQANETPELYAARSMNEASLSKARRFIKEHDQMYGTTTSPIERRRIATENFGVKSFSTKAKGKDIVDVENLPTRVNKSTDTSDLISKTEARNLALRRRKVSQDDANLVNDRLKNMGYKDDDPIDINKLKRNPKTGRLKILDSIDRKTKKLSNGGVVYASNGALISARNMGTDSVPAMLTPGEFVVNKNAASSHMGLLQSINRSKGGSVNYLANGGFVAPRYYSAGAAVGPTGTVKQNNNGGVSNGGSGSSFNEEILADFKSQFTEAVSTLGSYIDSFSQSASAFGGASETINSSVSRFGETASNIPAELNITGSLSTNMNVNHNGAQAFQSIQPAMEQYAMNNIKEAFGSVNSSLEGALGNTGTILGNNQGGLIA
jgi:hypothetical protein